MKKIVFGIILTVLLAGTIFLAFDIRPANATAVTIYINSDGTISPFSAPISLGSDNITYTFTGNISLPTYYGIMVERSNIVIDGNGYTVQGNQSGVGLWLGGIGNVTVKDTNVEDFSYGIILNVSSYDLISGNSVVANDYGIYLDFSSNNTVTDNGPATNNSVGIYLVDYSSNNVISRNTATNNQYGIELDDSSNNSVNENNLAANNVNGIMFQSSSNNSISENNITQNGYNGVWFAYSSNNNVIENNVTANNETGIGIDSYSNNNGVSGNNIMANGWSGIKLSFYSDSNSLSENNITANGLEGIKLESSSSNIISENSMIANSFDGVWLDNSSYGNIVSENSMLANSLNGIDLTSSSNNTIYHNDVINNAHQFNSYLSTNTWDDGYPSGGNFWSDYNGTDHFNGSYQNQTGSDGIGDTPYVIDSNNTDRYPLMGPFSSSTAAGLNVTVFPSDDVGLIFQNVTYAGWTTAGGIVTFPVALSNLTGEYVDVMVGARFSGNVTVRIIFDDSNMTQDQKSRLQLMQFTLPGDITGSTLGVPDGKVDIRDISYVAKQFGTSTSSPNWNPIADLTGPNGVPDGRVDIRDISYVARRFGTIGNSTNWINITTYVDTTNNVIYGITTHFSIIGIHQS